MTPAQLLLAPGLLVVLNLVTWASYRWDKRQAGRSGARRIAGRALALARLGGSFGALVAVSGHRQRTRRANSAFCSPPGLAMFTWLPGLAVVVAYLVL